MGKIGSEPRATDAVERPPQPRTVAVIDVGTNSIRMAVAEIHRLGEVRRGWRRFLKPSTSGATRFERA